MVKIASQNVSSNLHLLTERIYQLSESTEIKEIITYDFCLYASFPHLFKAFLILYFLLLQTNAVHSFYHLKDCFSMHILLSEKLGYALLAFGVLFFFGDNFVSLFVNEGGAGIVEGARQMLLTMSAFYIPLAFVNIIRFLTRRRGGRYRHRAERIHRSLQDHTADGRDRVLQSHRHTHTAERFHMTEIHLPLVLCDLQNIKFLLHIVRTACGCPEFSR